MEGYGSNVASLLPEEIKLEVAYMFRNIENKNLPPALAIIKPIHSKLDSLEPKRNDFDDSPSMNADLKGTKHSQTSVMVQRDISPNNNLEKLAKETQELASEKEKPDYKFSNCWFDKEKDLLWTK